MRILLFRNQILSHDNLESFLQNQGTGGSVVCCDSGPLALDIAEKCGINVAITHVDQDNPFEAGFLKELKESNPALNILAIVLPEHFECLGDDLENLVDDFITIPIDMGELKIRLRKGLRHSQLVKIEPQPAAPFKQGETGLSSKELTALQIQHKSSPLIHDVEIPESIVKVDKWNHMQ
jgi:DNA-binding NtrC family response regulator